MLIVETIGRIRREHLGKGKSIKEIARTLHLSRNTVRRILRLGKTAFSYEREVQPRPKLGAWADELDRLLSANAKASTRERLTLIRVYEELRALGYGGGYDAVRRYARRWGEQHASATAEAYIPLTFAPGEAYQFDWSHEIVVIDGVTTRVKVAHVRLCMSRMMFVRAYPRETQEMVFDAHERAFAFFKGACQRGIYDNMKTAVDAVFVGKDRKYNRRFLQVSEGGSRRLGDVSDAQHETAAIRADGRWLVGVLVCLWVAGVSVGLVGRLDLKQVAHARENLASVALGEEAVVTDAVEAVGQDVEEKAANELVRGKPYDAAAAAAAIVFVGERHVIVVDSDKPGIGDRGAMRVAGEIG